MNRICTYNTYVYERDESRVTSIVRKPPINIKRGRLYYYAHAVFTTSGESRVTYYIYIGIGEKHTYTHVLTYLNMHVYIYDTEKIHLSCI